MNIEITQREKSTAIETIVPEPIVKQPFVSAILYLKELFKKVLDETSSEQIDNLATYSQTNTGHISSSFFLDTLHFGMSLRQIQQLKDQGLFLPSIKDRRMEIQEKKEHWRSMVEAAKQGKDREFYDRIEKVLNNGSLIPHPSGCGGAYMIVDETGVPRFIAKPIDEDIFCLNNRKEFGSLFNDSDHRVRDDIPLYRSAQTDIFCWEVAQLSGLEEVTPKTVIGILKDENFYDFTTWLNAEEQLQFIQETGLPDKEKLCSIQEFIPNSQDFGELLHEFYAANLTDEEIASRLDQRDFEQVCLFLWLCYDNDGHGSNFRTYLKHIDASGKKIYGIKKIDNNLSFPEKNTHYFNTLIWTPNALIPASNELKQKIANLPVEQILNRMQNYEIYNCQKAFKERVEILQILAQREGITVGEIDLRIGLLSQNMGREIALNTMNTDQILALFNHASTSELSQESKTESNALGLI